MYVDLTIKILFTAIVIASLLIGVALGKLL